MGGYQSPESDQSFEDRHAISMLKAKAIWTWVMKWCLEEEETNMGKTG